MSLELDRRRELDVRLHDMLLEEGLASMGRYAANGADADVDVRIYIERNCVVRGDYGQLVGRRDEMQIVNTVDVKAKGTIYVENADGTGGQTYHLVDKVGDDGSVSRWVVRLG